MTYTIKLRVCMTHQTINTPYKLCLYNMQAEIQVGLYEAEHIHTSPVCLFEDKIA